MEFNKINKKLKLIKVRFLKKVKSIGPNYRNQPISKDLNKSQKLSVGIFFKLLKIEDTELLYDLMSSEC